MTNIPAFKRDRPTIGILAGWSPSEGARPDLYRGAVVLGMQSVARSRQCHLMISWGIRRMPQIDQFYSCWPDISPETDFVPVGPWNTDGLIVFTPLGNKIQSLYLQKLSAEGFPILFIASGEPGPTIAVNNQVGIHQAVTHLVEHGHHRIAFIAGRPTDKGDSDARLQAYHSAVAEYNLDVDDGLVAWGWHDFTEGYNAMQGLLRSNIKFTAAVASNDSSASGAIRAIREAGLQVPEDIAIIGFDDEPSALAEMPPLTSVHVPLNLIGQQAVLLMADHLQGLAALESIQVSPRLAKRQSCGCIPDIVFSATDGGLYDGADPVHPYTKEEVEAIQQELVTKMLSTLPPELRYPGGDLIRQTCTTVIDAFYKGLKQHNSKDFQTIFLFALREREIANGTIDYWQEMISILRREMMQLPVLWSQGKVRQLAENMLHQARAAIGESTQRQDHRHRYQLNLKAQTVNSVTARLSVALSDAQVVELLNTHLPEIGIRHARLMFFETDQEDTVGWSVAPGTAEDKSLDRRFRSREFPPPDLYPADELLNLILLPLVFQYEVLGYAAFEASDIESCTVIARQLAATIKVSRLHAQVVELSLTDALTRLHNRRYLDLFLSNEIARAHRFSHKMSLILIDIDYFKRYNDEFGHPGGDEALKRVAGCLTLERRATDVVARIGGEEFAIILPETDLNGALKCAEKVRTSVAAISNLKRPITISLGIAMLNENIDKAETLLHQADQALYDAKKNGRNRIYIYEEKADNSITVQNKE
jgi:diguanylate cyclase (GGDEF)-like protein